MSGAPPIDPCAVEARILDVLGVSPDLPWYTAYSGGVDSTVLLHVLARICRNRGISLTALHADHALHERSPAWRRHCLEQCRQWEIECITTRLDYPASGAPGPEGRARDARYRWFSEVSGGRGWLFTAHHRGDQAETVVERLTRGSGPRGLRGILPVARIHGVNVARPLLENTRGDIETYARRYRLHWVVDESNRDTSFTRNYIRSQVLPVLGDRWPGIDAALARTAAAMADAQTILDQAAASDLDGLDEGPARGDRSLDVRALQALGRERQRNVLRYWIHRERGVVLGGRRLERVMREVEAYPREAGGLCWPPVELRLYRGRLYLLRRAAAPPGETGWDLREALSWSEGVVLKASPARGRGVKEEAVRNGVMVGPRRGGEKCRLQGRRHRSALKNILQESGIPRWQRSRLPLIYVEGEIAAIAGLHYCEPYAAGPDESGIAIDVTYL